MPHRLKRDRARASSRQFDRPAFRVISTDRREWRNLSRAMLRTLRRTGKISPLRGPTARSGRYDGRGLRLRYPDTPRLELAPPPLYLPRRRPCLRTGPSLPGLPARRRLRTRAGVGGRGEVPEWSNGAVSKTVVRFAYRGFESHPLRHYCLNEI